MVLLQDRIRVRFLYKILSDAAHSSLKPLYNSYVTRSVKQSKPLALIENKQAYFHSFLPRTSKRSEGALTHGFPICLVFFSSTIDILEGLFISIYWRL